MQARKGLGPLCIIPCQAATARCPGMTTLHHPALGQPYKALLGCGQLDDCQLPMMSLGRLRRLRPRVLVVNVGELDRVAGHFWHFFGQCMDVAPVLRMGGSDRPRQEMAQGIHGQVHLRAPAACGPIVARSCATCRRRLERAALENGGRRQGVRPWATCRHRT